MKATVLAAAAAVLAGGASAASRHGHRHAHALFEKKSADTGKECVESCTTIYSTVTGEPTLLPPASTAPPSTTGPATVPTPEPHPIESPGTYTFPASTIVVTETQTDVGGSSTGVPSGTHTLGGITTVVGTGTTIVVPVATTEVHNGVVTSIIKTTTFVCPVAGTYTIAPITTTVPSDTTVTVPVIETFPPGTYTAPAVVTTVTETKTVVYCPYTSQTPEPAPAPTSQAPPPPPPPPPPPAITTHEAPPPVKPSNTPSSSVVPKPSHAPLPGSTTKQWAMTYTAYAETAEGGCKSASEVMDDVTAIAKAGFSAIRVYSTDCDTLPNVGAAVRKLGLRLIVGIFIGQAGCDNASPTVADQISALKEWAEWDLVDLAAVGNEALFNNFCTVGELTSLIQRVKSELGATGYNGAFTTTDIVTAYTNNDVSALCAVIDIVATNAHAYFNPDTKPEDAGAFVASQLKIVEDVCSLPGVVLETGWPNAGVCNGVACAGPDEQRAAIESIEKALGSKAVFFSFRNDPWKQPGACNCERNWGCAEVWGV
ncbi:exo-beta-1,3-glucanase [Dichotomopilus funicola]|uniref:Probable beta-glucosidase btgE n=1 Tax=Dichotomopilus funicola TaxID=1934379 RepID=A0AAN6ZLV2_9PEZI|nr:exo-beta-1,3-glucanase [Dichotomopilus funicola]